MPYTKFDSDPDALAWAREKIQKRIDHYRDFEQQCQGKGESGKLASSKWRLLAWRMKQDFIGGDGCVIAAFDERLPHFITLMEQSVAATVNGKILMLSDLPYTATEQETWANLTGAYDDINDYERMCLFCHRKFDAVRRAATGKRTSPDRGRP